MTGNVHKKKKKFTASLSSCRIVLDILECVQMPLVGSLINVML